MPTKATTSSAHWERMEVACGIAERILGVRSEAIQEWAMELKITPKRMFEFACYDRSNLDYSNAYVDAFLFSVVNNLPFDVSHIAVAQ